MKKKANIFFINNNLPLPFVKTLTQPLQKILLDDG